MCRYIVIYLLHIVMQLHIHTIIVDDQLIDIGLYLLHLIDVQEQSVGGHEDKALRELFSCVFVQFHDPGIQPWLIVAI